MIFPDGTKQQYESGKAAADAVFDHKYLISTVRAVNDAGGAGAPGDAAGSAALYRADQCRDRRGDRYPQQGPQQTEKLHRSGANGGAQKAVRRLHRGAGRPSEEKENSLLGEFLENYPSKQTDPNGYRFNFERLIDSFT